MRTITSAQGLGDLCWIFQKLINQDEKFDWIIPCNDFDAEVQKRAFQLQKLFPSLINSMTHKKMKFRRDIASFSHRGTWEQAGKMDLFLEANSHLEAGQRIEKFLPDLKTSFIIPFQTTTENKKQAKEILKGKKLCGIYTSNQAKIKDSWLENDWIELMNLILKHDPEYRFVMIGAEYDRPFLENIINEMDTKWVAFKYPLFSVCINNDLGATIEVLKGLDLLIGFQSGITIINELIGAKQTVMLYWNDFRHANIINAWPDPERIKSGAYKGCHFCPPKQIFDWLIQNKKI